MARRRRPNSDLTTRSHEPFSRCAGAFAGSAGLLLLLHIVLS